MQKFVYVQTRHEEIKVVGEFGRNDKRSKERNKGKMYNKKKKKRKQGGSNEGHKDGRKKMSNVRERDERG